MKSRSRDGLAAKGLLDSCTLHGYHFFHNIEIFEINHDKPRENVYSTNNNTTNSCNLYLVLQTSADK